jgi:peptidyl-prolyl cis-trans isomerase C
MTTPKALAQHAGPSVAAPALALAVLVLAAFGLAACGGGDGGGRPTGRADTAVAAIDGRTIWASDVQREAVAQGIIGDGESLDPSSELFRRVLDEVVDQKLLAAEATRRGLGSDPAVRRRLDAAREQILGDMLVQKVVEQAVSDSSIRGLYEAQRKLAKPVDEFRARQIVLSTQAEAEAVRKLLANGAAFEAIAGQRSVDVATRFNGGDLGYFTADVMPDAYAGALKTAKPGDIVGPLKTDAGWVLLKLEDRRQQPPMTLDQARPQIVRFVTYDQVRDLLQKLRGKAKVTLLTTPAASQPAPANPPPKKSP